MQSLVEKYKVQGKVYAWAYLNNTGNYPGWNLTADRPACKSLLALLLLMKTADYPTKKAISTEKVTELQAAVANEGSRTLSADTLIFNYLKNTPNIWSMNRAQNNLEINFGDQNLQELMAAIQKVSNNQGDFAIADHKEENILYFWWYTSE